MLTIGLHDKNNENTLLISFFWIGSLYSAYSNCKIMIYPTTQYDRLSDTITVMLYYMARYLSQYCPRLFAPAKRFYRDICRGKNYLPGHLPRQTVSPR